MMQDPNGAQRGKAVPADNHKDAQKEYESAMMAKLLEAHSQVTFGATYRHYKSRSKHYQVQGLVIIEATNTVGVVYQAQYGERLSYVRPLGNWLGEVQVDGKMVPRFKQVKTGEGDLPAAEPLTD